MKDKAYIYNMIVAYKTKAEAVAKN